MGIIAITSGLTDLVIRGGIMRWLSVLMLFIMTPQVHAQTVMVKMEPDWVDHDNDPSTPLVPVFPEFGLGAHILNFPIETEDSHDAWDGNYFVPPSAGLYEINLHIWVEDALASPGLTPFPMYMGVQIRKDNFPIIAWTADLADSVFSNSYVSHLRLSRLERLLSGVEGRIHIVLVVIPEIGDGADPSARVSLSEFPYETWLSIRKVE